MTKALRKVYYRKVRRVKRWHVEYGDSLDILRTLEDYSFDSMITDPPAGISFMGSDWDSNKGGRHQWIEWLTLILEEAERLLKPGAHLLVWALPKTSHWTATAIEEAGFEVRDVVTHLFGSGFPKSRDISKAIDHEFGATRKVIGKHKAPASPAGEVMATGLKRSCNITDPELEEAKRWEGWGTALKPASEHWILARKDLSEDTVAVNVIGWDTGAINVDGCRIASEGFKPKERKGATKLIEERPWNRWQLETGNRKTIVEVNELGRFPANVVLSGDAPKLLDDQSGITSSSQNKRSDNRKHANNKIYGEGKGLGRRDPYNSYEDEGGASRFFYCAKPSKKERNANGKVNNLHPTVKPLALMRYLCRLITPPGGLILDPFCGSGSTGVAALQEGFRFYGIDDDPDIYRLALKRIACFDRR